MLEVPLKSKIARSVLSLLPKAGLLPPPSRPAGISAFMRVWNEKAWLEASVESLKDHVDEIVAVDNGSTDGSLETLRLISAKVPKLKVFSFPGNALWELSNFALEKTSYRWLLKWDADFVGFPGAEGRFRKLAEYVDSLDKRVYYHINLRFLEVTADFRHQLPGLRTRRDIELFTYSPSARYVPVTVAYKESPFFVKLPARFTPDSFKLRFEGLDIPLYYRMLCYDPIVGIHVNVKPGVRHLLGYFHLQWQGSDNFLRGQSLKDYALEQVRTAWGFPDLETAAEFYMGEFAKCLSPYDPALGPLPENIEKLAASAAFRIVYKDGKPSGRAE